MRGSRARIFNGPGPATANTVDGLTIPDTRDALEEMLNDAGTMRQLFAQPGAFPEFVTKYAKATLDRDQEIATQVREQTERTISAWLKEQESVTEGPFPRPNLAPVDIRADVARQERRLYNPKAMGAKIDDEFDGAADYFRSIWHNTSRDAKLQAKLSRVRNAFSSTVPSEGGFLIPETLRADLLRVSLETSIVRPRARVIPMETLRVPFPAIDSTSNVSSVFGGIVCYWTEEGAALTQSQAAFGRVVLDAKKLTAYTEVPNELIADSITSFDAFISDIFPEALGFYEDYAFLRGSGVGEPLGVLNGSGAIAVSRAGGGNAVDFADVVGMYARMLPSSLGRAVWVASIDTLPSLASMTVSGATIPLWLTNGQVIEGVPTNILGRPVFFTEKVPAAGNLGDLNFIDFGFYLLGDRQAMSALSSPHYKFANDQTAYRIIERVDGRPWLSSAITPKNSSATLSPYVKLS
jgi:HK97 family phage major capsid protein